MLRQRPPKIVENGRQRMTIEADWPEVAADYEDIVSAYATVRVPGFRPGEVPSTSDTYLQSGLSAVPLGRSTENSEEIFGDGDAPF
ncbi:MAG TPA: trigger factor [Nitrospirota bacterium]|nr:trigger factor [Nitrospirota bacterium]